MIEQFEPAHGRRAAEGHVGTFGDAMLTHPDQVIGERRIPAATKRAILASWASDVHAVEGAPALRQLPSGAVVGLDDILHALRSLDAAEGKEGPTADVPWRFPFARRKGGLASRANGSNRRRNPRDDDEDPPPAPAVAALPARYGFVRASSTRPAWMPAFA